MQNITLHEHLHNIQKIVSDTLQHKYPSQHPSFPEEPCQYFPHSQGNLMSLALTFHHKLMSALQALRQLVWYQMKNPKA